MTHPTTATAGRPRARGLRAAAAVGTLVLATGAATFGLASTAQAATQSFTVYSQVNPLLQPTPTNLGEQSITLTVTPSTAAPGAPIEVQVSSSTLALENGPASAAGANSNELVAVVALNGVDYALRGSQLNQEVAVNDGSTATTPTNYKAGWVISSTPGNSSSASDNGTGNNVAGTSGIGATIRGAETVPVALVAPATPGTYPLTLKAIVVNSISGSGTPALNNGFDQVINTSSTNTKNNFNNNVESSYFAFSPSVDLIVSAATEEPTEEPTGEPTTTSTATEPPVEIPTGSIGGLGIAVIAAVAGIGAYAWTRRPRTSHNHE